MPYSECDEVADALPLNVRRLNFDEALAIVRNEMPDESETILSNVAWRLMERSHEEHPDPFARKDDGSIN